MSQPAAPAPQPALPQASASRIPGPFAARYSAQLMQMLAQLVMLR